MKKILLPIILVSITFLTVFSQSVQKLNKTGSTEIFLDKKVDAFGPRGHVSIKFGSNDLYDSITLKGYPTLKNLPDSLKHMETYTYIFDHKQFYYQNYRNGIYTKKFFVDYFKKQKYELRDTLYLIPQKVKCYFSYAVGFDRNKKMVYVVDTNGDNDFADEKLMESKKALFTDEAASAIDISVESFDGKNIIRDNVRCLIKLTSNEPQTQIVAGVSFPQFRYTSISYGGEVYNVSTNHNMPGKSIYICKAQPYFRSLSADMEIKPNQVVAFGKTYFKYEPDSQNLYKIKLTSGFSETDNKTPIAMQDAKLPSIPVVSERVGMIAPDISGINILEGKTLSLNALRGKYVFLDFWATWCGPCVAEFPNIRKVYDTFSSDQFVILGVCEDDRNGKIKAFLKDQEVIWPTIIKSASSTKTKGYNISSFPTSFLIGPDGKIITTNLRGNDLFIRLENLKVKKK